MVFTLKIRSKAHFRFFLFNMTWYGAEICSFASGYPIVPACVVEKIIFSHWNNLSLCSKSVDHIVGSISELAILCHSSIFLFSYQYYIALITVALSFLKSGSLSPSSAFFFFKVVLATPGPLHFHITLESVHQLLQTGMLRSDFDHWTCRSLGRTAILMILSLIT